MIQCAESPALHPLLLVGHIRRDPLLKPGTRLCQADLLESAHEIGPGIHPCHAGELTAEREIPPVIKVVLLQGQRRAGKQR